MNTNYFNLLAVITTVLSLCSCANQPKADYRFVAGGRYEKYTENETVPLNQSLANSLGGSVTTVSGNPSQITTTATGAQIGFVEEFPVVNTTITFFYNSYAPVNYTFNSSSYGVINETLATTGSGLDATIGFNLTKGSFKVRPGFSYKMESQSMTTTVSGGSLSAPVISKTSQTVFVWGGGLAFEFPFLKNSKMVLQVDYRVPSKSIYGVSSLNYTSAQLNFVFGRL